MANERHTDVRLWEPDYSTRQAAHPQTKYYPFRQALSTTAATLLTVGQGEIAVNLVPNPSMETAMTTGDASGYVVTGAAIAQSSAQQAAGANSMEVNPANSAAGEGFYWETPLMPLKIEAQMLTAQIEHLEKTDDGTAIKLEIRAVDGTTVLGTSGTVALASSWTRSTVTYIIPANTAFAAYRVYMTTATQHNTNFYVDKFMVEIRDDTQAVSTYLDGDSGINYEWAGAANASSSRKRPALSNIRAISIKNESGTSAEIVYVAFDTTATSTYTGTTYIGTGIPVLAGATFETMWPLGFHQKVSIISASGTPTVSGVIWGV